MTNAVPVAPVTGQGVVVFLGDLAYHYTPGKSRVESNSVRHVSPQQSVFQPQDARNTIQAGYDMGLVSLHPLPTMWWVARHRSEDLLLLNARAGACKREER